MRRMAFAGAAGEAGACIGRKYSLWKRHALVWSVGVSFCWREQVARATIAGIERTCLVAEVVELGLHLL